MYKQKLLTIKEALVSKAGVDSLEMRIFLAVNLICMMVLATTAVFNYIIGLPKLFWLMSGVFVITCVLYCLARFRKVLNLSVTIYSITFHLLLVLNYFYNSGISGPTLLGFLLSFFVTIAIVPRRQYWFWLVVNVVVVFGLLAVSYFNPAWVAENYSDQASRFIDFSYSYIIVALLVMLVTNRIRTNYIQEKALAEQKAIELEQSNTTKNKLFSILAHDLRSPLSSIQNFLEILSEYKLSEEERQTIQRALLNETVHTQQMLSNVLSWSKGQMDGVSVNLGPLNLAATLDITLKIQRTAAAEKCIVLENDIDCTCCIIADPDMLQLVIRNLVNNAVKFTPPGGKVLISAHEEEGDCRITVSDNGKGIPYDQQEGIFSLKAKSTFGTNNEKGIGLGLMLCKEFTELQHGRIGFQSIPGKGTSFYIILTSCSSEAKPGVTMQKHTVK